LRVLERSDSIVDAPGLFASECGHIERDRPPRVSPSIGSVLSSAARRPQHSIRARPYAARHDRATL
jgi:hypothetical protein